METQQKHFASSLFFGSQFPFSMKRYQHTREEYNNTMRCTREFWKVIYVNEGHGWKVINSKRYPITEGSLFIIHPGDSTTFVIESEYLDLYNLIFMPEFIEEGIKSLSDDFRFFSIFHRDFTEEMAAEEREWLYVLESNPTVTHIVKDIYREHEKEPPNYRNAIRFKLLDLLIQISRLSSRKVQSCRKSSLPDYIDHIIERHYAEDFSLDRLAEEIGLSKNHICRLYRSAKDKTITDSLLERRLTVARGLLASTEKSISEVCYECGFNDLSYFYRAFKKATKQNPGSYRRKFGLH